MHRQLLISSAKTATLHKTSISKTKVEAATLKPQSQNIKSYLNKILVFDFICTKFMKVLVEPI